MMKQLFTYVANLFYNLKSKFSKDGSDEIEEYLLNFKEGSFVDYSHKYVPTFYSTIGRLNTRLRLIRELEVHKIAEILDSKKSKPISYWFVDNSGYVLEGLVRETEVYELVLNTLMLYKHILVCRTLRRDNPNEFNIITHRLRLCQSLFDDLVEILIKIDYSSEPT